MPESFDVIVIGGGTAGLVTASGCARLGRRVALIEKEALGGDCLWTGCVPTKALVATAKLAHQMRTAGRWGLQAHEPEISPRAIMASMREARRITSKHDDPQKFRRLGIDVIEGEAKLVSRSEVVTGDRRLTAKDIVIATGSRTAVPPIEGLAEAGFADHVSFLARDEFPRSVLILGGGAIGIEFAQIFRRFGAEVTVVEMLDEIIGKEDHDVISRIRQILEGEGISIRAGWKVAAVRTEGGRKIAVIESRSGATEQVVADGIFVASGRRGNIEGIGLEEAGVRTDRSYVVVDRYLQTSVPRIWACGDVHGGLQFTHVAAYEAVKLVRNMLFPGKSPVSYDDVPWALYTDPEVAHLGLTETEAREKHGDDIRTYSVEMADVDRAVVDRLTAGFVKFVCTRKGNILGAHLVAANASALMGGIVGARKQGQRIGTLATVVSPYPSMADAIQKAASLHYQQLSDSWIGAIGRRIAAWAQ
ncbi:MAG TPA: FAD-dependent oxidoreductase [Thermoanaerobaculia bacterium]|nr:FAD-dependent oxidoreductase [Thermoanaerobaculia bacterium]